MPCFDGTRNKIGSLQSWFCSRPRVPGVWAWRWTILQFSAQMRRHVMSFPVSSRSGSRSPGGEPRLRHSCNPPPTDLAIRPEPQLPAPSSPGRFPDRAFHYYILKPDFFFWARRVVLCDAGLLTASRWRSFPPSPHPHLAVCAPHFCASVFSFHPLCF
jgi:hypothetical protein